MCASLLAVGLWFVTFRCAAAMGSSGNSGLRVRRLAGMNMDLHIMGQLPAAPETKQADSHAYSGNQMFLQIGSSSEEESVDSSTASLGNASLSKSNSESQTSDVDDDLDFSGSAHVADNSSAVSDAANDMPASGLELAMGNSSELSANSDVVISDSKHLVGNSSASSSADDKAITSGSEHVTDISSALSAEAVDASVKESSQSAGTRVSLLRSEVAGTRVSLLRSEVVDNAMASDGVKKAAAFEASLANASDKDDRELMVCLGSIVVLLCTFVCITRLAPTFRCLAARQPIVREQPPQAALQGDLKKNDPAATDESEMTAAIKPAVAARGEGQRSSADLVEEASCKHAVSEQRRARSSLGEQVSNIELDALVGVLEKLQAAGAHAGGFDCAIARPLSSHQVLRMQAKVLGASHGSMLTPLTLQPCVLYQATVCRRLHAGVPSVPVAFASMSTSFQVALCDHPDVHIAVEGDDVMLFDMCDGQFSHTGLFAEAPELLQDFVLTHRSAVPGGQWQTSSSFRSEAAYLEFQQCALLAESKVTLVGELVRDVGGTLAMRPTDLDQSSCTPRVLVSDDPVLL